MKIAIIGAGIAGTAAAFEIARQGGRAKLIHDLTGASGLYSGALDDEPRHVAGQPPALEHGLLEFSKQLGAWELELAPRRIATLEGNVRPARASDRALLDLEQCAGKRVAVVELERDDWDAPLLANSFASSAWARKTNTQFFAAAVPDLEKGFERRISGYDFAALHDAPERAQALQEALRTSKVGGDAWLFGPWLGIERPLAEELRRALGVPVGETTSAPGGAAGARFERARDRLLARIADVQRGHLSSLERTEGGYLLRLRDQPAESFDTVVLATGGVAAGGVVLERGFERRGGTGFHLSFSAPLPLALDSEVVEGVSSLSGFDFTERGFGALLEIGIASRPDGSVPESPGIFVAGDASAGRRRTALIAAVSGLTAARAALDYSGRLH